MERSRRPRFKASVLAALRLLEADAATAIQRAWLRALDRVRAEGASAGVYCVGCPGAHLSRIEGVNMRGPFPRGQCVQFDKSNNSVLEDFSCVNLENASWTEDNINVFESNNAFQQASIIGCGLQSATLCKGDLDAYRVELKEFETLSV